MSTHRKIAAALKRAAEAQKTVVLATVVRITGSSYGGVGARMVIAGDESITGLVSGGCLESDVAEHARRVRESGAPEIVSYDTRNDDDAPWGLGLGCNGLIEVLLEPLSPPEAARIAELIVRALAEEKPAVLATVVRRRNSRERQPAVGAHTLLTDTGRETSGDWGDASVLAWAAACAADAREAGRRGLLREYEGVEIAFEVIAPSLRLVICGSGADVLPLLRFASDLGWDVTVVDHGLPAPENRARFPGARLVQCPDAEDLAQVVRLSHGTAAVVMSHHFTRDRSYVRALLASDVSYIGVLGPRARTEKMLAATDSESRAAELPDPRVYFPVGIDLGGDGPEAIALSIVAEISVVMRNRTGGHLRDHRGSLHSETPATKPAASGARTGAVILAAGPSTRLGYPKQLVILEGEPLVRRAALAAIRAGADTVVVVTGAHSVAVAAAVSGIRGIRVVFNPEWESGLASSLRAGIKALREAAACDGMLVMLTDQPLIGTAELRALLAAFDAKHRLIASEYAGTLGVPAVFGAEHLDELMALSGDHGAGTWLRAHRGDVTAVPLMAAELDVDTAADCARLEDRATPLSRFSGIDVTHIKPLGS